jgi:signal transduction histidine kinase
MGRAALFLLSAVGVSVLVADILLAPTRRDLGELAAYLALSGIATVLVSAVLTRLLERHARLTLIRRFVLVTVVASAVLVVNIVVLARLMFISTDHDLQVLLSAAVFGAIVAVGFAVWAAYGPLARIAVVNGAIRDLAAGHIGHVITTPGDDEIALLARDVNVLSRRLAEADAERRSLDAQRRELTAAISHDLRTPLSTIRAMVDALDDGVVSDRSEMKRYFVTIRRDVERLNRMIDDLFELAQIDAGAMRLRLRPVAVQEIVSEVVDAMRVRAERADVDLELSVQDDMPSLMLDGDRLGRAIANLLRNALEHTPPGGGIRVCVRGGSEHATVEVSDTGEGIEEDDLPNIWTRFYRADQSRARTEDGDGVGLGLAIAKGIVELHGGQVAVESRPGAGSVFTMVLPIKASLDQMHVKRETRLELAPFASEDNRASRDSL